MCFTFITRSVHGRFYGLDLCLGKLAIDTLDSKAKGKKPGSTSSLLGLVAARKRILEFYSD